MFPLVALGLVERAIAGRYELALEAPERRGLHKLRVRLVGRKGTVMAAPMFSS